MLKLERGNLQAFCRTCLQRLEATSGTAPKYSIRETPNLMKLLILCTTLNINEDADKIYPQLLCAKCYETLQEFQSFRDTALQSNEMLRKIVKNEDDVLIAPSDINTQKEKYTIKIKSEDLEDMELVDIFKAEEPEMTSSFYVYDVEEANISNACLNNTKNNVETCDDENTVSSDAQNRSDVYFEEASNSAHAIKRKSNVDGNDSEVLAKKRLAACRFIPLCAAVLIHSPAEKTVEYVSNNAISCVEKLVFTAVNALILCVNNTQKSIIHASHAFLRVHKDISYFVSS